MKAYILTLAGIILVSAVVSLLVPQGKMSAFIKGMTKLLVLAVVVAPFISYFKKEEFEFTNAEINWDVAYLERSASLIAKEDEEEISSYLSEDYGVTAEVGVTRAWDGNYTMQIITVKITDSGIFGQDDHINNIAEIKSRLEERYGCTVEIYEA